jgi:aryl-alcohol dehydrogenase-like predicted oxidoreductase
MTVPALGFGTAPILGRIGSRPSRRALAHAYANGIRHFDTARSYGWGEAESLLGTFLSQHPRESYTLVSKCGIVPVRRSRGMSAAKGVARKVMGALPGTRGVLRRFASLGAFQPVRSYDVAVLSESFEASLRELKTGYLDLLLLHNFEIGKTGLPEVVGWMRDLQRAGRIRRFGFSIEGELHQGLAYLAREDLLHDCVIQTEVSRQLLQLPEEWRGLPFIAHSPFRFAGAFEDSTRRPLRLEQLLAALGERCRCEALVCSMFDPGHIAQNVAARRLASGFGPAEVQAALGF